MPEYPHQHIQVAPRRAALQFQGNGRGSFKRRGLSRKEHAVRLQRQLEEVGAAFVTEHTRREQVQQNPADFGLILNVESAPGLSLKVESLEKMPSANSDGIYLLNVRYHDTQEGVVTKAAILVPYGQLVTLENKVKAFADPTKDKTKKDGVVSPRHADLLCNIQFIGVAALDALWTEPEPLPTTTEAIWWELWISRVPRAERQAKTWVQLFEETRQALNLQINQFRLRLPDNEIVLVKATRQVLESSLPLLNTLTEVRKVHTCSIGLTDLPKPEQHEWVADAIERIITPDASAPAVCLLDTGVNNGHPLIAPLLSPQDLHTVIPAHGNTDHPNPLSAHGTPMAGLAAYDDLRTLMLSTGAWQQRHRLESVKIIHDGNEHNPDNYGAVTREAIAHPETVAPQRKRAYCMAITQRDFPAQGQPSSWSAAVDAATAGSGEDGSPKRLMLISAGNRQDFLNYQHPQSNHKTPVQNPAQAWNALTVGAMTKRAVITEADNESQRARAIAPIGTLSPFTSTSRGWESHWPIKPDFVMEGGNLAQSETGEFFQRESLELISTASDFSLDNPLCGMNATSAATASASRLAAMLMERFPNYWPETYRGLMVHSARWLPNMLNGIDPHQARTSSDVENLLRDYGFGEPYQPRLFGSGESGVTMIIQDTIQPYDPASKAGEAKLHHFHLHQLPLPKEVFDRHRDVAITLRVTLSYFIEPNPGSRCWLRSKKYRYASHLLRFKIKGALDSEAAFRASLEKEIEDEENAQLDSGTDDVRLARPDSKWAVGPKLRGKAGSLVQDIWKGNPAELAEMGQIAIFPAKGWFATRSFPVGHESHNCHQRQVRYSLIISIDAERDIGLYAAIAATNIVRV